MAAKKKAGKKKAVMKKEFKPSSSTQAKMRTLRAELDKVEKLEREIAKAKTKIKDLKSQLYKVLVANGLESMSSARINLRISKNDTFHIVNGQWAQFENYVHKHKAYDLYHRRISATACKERFGTKPPKFLQYKEVPVLNHTRK